jgi:hypothetical protein
VGGTSKSVLFVDAASKLAQENASFQYDPAVNALHVDQLFTLLRRESDGTWLTMRGSDGATVPPLLAAIADFFVNAPDPLPDRVFTIGLNLASGGGLLDNNFGGIGIEMEGYFNNGVTKIQEWRVACVPKPSSGHPTTRVLSIGQNQETGATTLGFESDQIKWFDGVGNQQGLLGAGVHVADGSYRSSTYGSVLLEQLNSLGTVHANLFVLANGFVDGQADRLAIGVGGAVSRTQIYKGLDVYSFDYTVAPALMLATSTGPVAPLNFTVDIDSIDPNGVVSRHPGSMFVRVLGGASSWYINRSATDPGTAWSLVTAIP